MYSGGTGVSDVLSVLRHPDEQTVFLAGKFNSLNKGRAVAFRSFPRIGIERIASTKNNLNSSSYPRPSAAKLSSLT